MNRIPTPSTTLNLMSQFLRANIAAIESLESTIEDLCADLRDSTNDWHRDACVLRLTTARDAQRAEIVKAAANLRTVEELRRQAGLEASVLARVIAEYVK